MKPEVYDYLALIDKSKESMFVPFDEIDAETRGTASKAYAMCYGYNLRDMYFDIKNNPNTNYLTCLNGFIRSYSLDEFDRTKVSVILKKTRGAKKEFAIAELVGSRVAEMFGMKTAYVAPVKDDLSVVLSVDFMNGKQKLESFGELTNNDNLSKFNDIGTWLRVLTNQLKTNKQFKGLSDKKINELIKDFIKHFLIRKFVLKDNDLNSGNIVFVFSKKDYSDMQVVSLDYEYCLNNNNDIVDMTSNIPEDYMQKCFDFLAQEYPQITSEVVDEISMNTYQQKRLKSILSPYFKDDMRRMYWEQEINRGVDNIRKSFELSMDKFGQTEKEDN